MVNEYYSDVRMDKYLYKALHMMLERRIVLPINASVYMYHHLGIEKFEKTGGIFINVVNKEYRKSYVVVLPGQVFPAHYHKIKQESFYVLSGILDVCIEGEKFSVLEGGIINIERGQMHSFSSEKGVIFEEISTTYMLNDSFFEDASLDSVPYCDRKTIYNEAQWKEIYKLWKE